MTTHHPPPWALLAACSSLWLLAAAVSAQQAAAPAPAIPLSTRCAVTKGVWCNHFYTQPEVPSKPPPRGDTDCPSNCSNIGNCDYDTGTCYCPVGYGGPDCSQPRKRPCWRMGPDKKDLGWTLHHEWSHSRCAGICDDSDSMCYCPEETKYGRKPAPPGSPLGTPPLQGGRPMYWCQPSSDANNNTIKWGAVPYEHLLGPNGWCNGEIPTFHCPCRLDGLMGERCQIVGESYCSNQCTGHGQCRQGFCKCNPGWYGNDCSRKRRGLPMEQGDQDSGAQPWLRAAITPVPSAQDPPDRAMRKRPFVYVYDTWPEYNTDIMQYRIDRKNCVYRLWALGNNSEWADRYTYAIESVLIEMFMTSGHRTYDPNEADFFFVPTMAGCIYDVYGWNPIPMWPAGIHGSRPFGSSMMLRAAHRWLSHQFPWFNRTQGQDHIWLMPHDEGACAAPKEIWPGVILSHWGRMDYPHNCNSQYHADNYTVEIQHQELPEGFLWNSVNTHPCFDPEKDLVIPSFKGPSHYQQSIYMGNKHPGGDMQLRDIFIFFRGDIGRNRDDKPCTYSRCIRQTIAKVSEEQQWRSKYNIVYGEGQGGDYSTQLSRARFCLVLPGDGWSARFEDAMLHGCIPVIIMDNTQVPFESLLDIDSFSLRILQKDIPHIPVIVQAVTKEREEQMRSNVNKVWQRFRWSGLQMIDNEINNILRTASDRNGGALPQQEGIQYAGTSEDGAFSTVMQWLLSRVPYTRGVPRPTEKLCSRQNFTQCEHVAALCKQFSNLTYASVPAPAPAAVAAADASASASTSLPEAGAATADAAGEDATADIPDVGSEY